MNPLLLPLSKVSNGEKIIELAYTASKWTQSLSDYYAAGYVVTQWWINYYAQPHPFHLMACCSRVCVSLGKANVGLLNTLQCSLNGCITRSCCVPHSTLSTCQKYSKFLDYFWAFPMITIDSSIIVSFASNSTSLGSWFTIYPFLAPESIDMTILYSYKVAKLIANLITILIITKPIDLQFWFQLSNVLSLLLPRPCSMNI